MGFFDDYPDFFREKSRHAFPNRLNQRYQALIESNKEIIQNKKILDIASHDGRWSFAALKNGAKHVIGVEFVSNHVKEANKIMEKYQIPKTKYNFIVGDIHHEITKIPPNTIDTVFCFGFFYHTLDHMNFLSKITSLKPKYVIFDTLVSSNPALIIKVKEEGQRIGDPRLAGIPSKKVFELMLKYSGFTHIHYYDWQNKNIQDWSHLEDYKAKRHITLCAEVKK